MATANVGILVIDGVSLDEVTRLRARVEADGAAVTLLVPTGGPIPQVGGRYLPGATGPGARRSLAATSTAQIDALILPASITADALSQCPEALQFLHSKDEAASPHPIIVMDEVYVIGLLDRGATLAGLAREDKRPLSGAKSH